MKRTCKDCGKDFILSKSEMDFYKSKNLSFPKRCKECRTAKRGGNSPSGSDNIKQNQNKVNSGYNKSANTSGLKQGAQTNKKADVSKKFSSTNYSRKEPVYVPTYGQNAQNKSEFLKYALIAAVAIIVVLLGVIAFISNSSGNNSGDINSVTTVAEPTAPKYTFASKKLLEEHYQKHGIEMGFASAADYEQAASDVVNNPNALSKKEAEDNDDVYYVEATNEFVVVSTRGFIRTYFKPDKGKAYYDKQ